MLRTGATTIYPEKGIGDVLKSVLARLMDHIKFALIYGSAAKGELSKRSDVDVLIVGDVSFAEIGKMLNSVQETLQREINPSVYTFMEFKKNWSRIIILSVLFWKVNIFF